MAGRPRRRALIAAQVAAKQVGAVTAPVKRPPGRPPGSGMKKVSEAKAAVATLRPPPEIDDGFGATLAEFLIDNDTNKVFEQLRQESLKFALEIMQTKLDPDERSYNKLIGVKQQIMAAVMTATTRIRPGDLREREDDGMGALLARVRAGDSLSAAEPTEDDLLN